MRSMDVGADEVIMEMALIRCFRRMGAERRKRLLDMASDWVQAERFAISLKDPPAKEVIGK